MQPQGQRSVVCELYGARTHAQQRLPVLLDARAHGAVYGAGYGRVALEHYGYVGRGKTFADKAFHQPALAVAQGELGGGVALVDACVYGH